MTEKSPDTKSRAYTIEEVAALLGISRGLAYEGARAGTIPTVRVGRRLLVPRATFDKLFPSGDAEPPAETV